MAQGGNDYDVKTKTETDEYYGSILLEENGEAVYASARDVGNFAAGMMGESSIVPNDLIFEGFGAYQKSRNLKAVGGSIIMNVALWCLGETYLLSDEPYHGEAQLSGKGIELGMQYGDKNK
jgi:hypothetical protein